MGLFNAQLDGDRGAPKSPFSGTSASSNSNLPGYSCHHVCNTSLCNWLGESRSQAGEACPAPEKTKCLGQNRYLFNGTRPRPSASGDAKVCMVLQTCLQPKTCTVFSYIQDLNTIEEKGHRFPGGAPHPLQHLGQTPPCC
ncbi:unnamed protein product [Lepidochelys olivacea]